MFDQVKFDIKDVRLYFLIKTTLFM